MRTKFLVVSILPLLIGASSCSGKAAECNERKESIEEAAVLIKAIEDQIKGLESQGDFGAATADALRPNLNEVKDLQRAVIEEMRELGCE